MSSIYLDNTRNKKPDTRILFGITHNSDNSWNLFIDRIYIMDIKIGAISDIHGEWDLLRNLENKDNIELLIIAGDLCSSDNVIEQKEELISNFQDFIKQFSNLQETIIIPGNHDFYLERIYNSPVEIWKILGSRIKILVDEEYTFDSFIGNGSIKIYGNPRCSLYTFAFPHLAGEEDIHKIPKTVDILVTHEDPRCNQTLKNHIELTRPDIHIFGHLHQPGNWIDNGIKYYNVSQINKDLVCPKLHLIQ